MLIILPTQSNSGLPEGWEVRHSNSKNLPYYFNPSTKESRWDPPSDTNTEKLKSYMATHHSSGIAPSSSAKTEGKIRAAHLLVKHKDSRRPSSWREEKITRSKDEAIEILKAHEKKIRGGDAKLADLATKESDCSSARKGGDLWVTHSQKRRLANMRKGDTLDVARCRKSSRKRHLDSKKAR